MKKIKLKSTSGKQQFALFITLVIMLIGIFSVWQVKEIKNDINTLYEITSGNIDTESNKQEDNAVEYKVTNQYIEQLDVADPESMYKFNEDPAYTTKSVRVVELQITNNNDWVYSTYGSIGKIEESGEITRTMYTIRPSQDKNYSANGASLELAPGGTGTLYLYFEDYESEVLRLYDVDSSKEINLNY